MCECCVAEVGTSDEDEDKEEETSEEASADADTNANANNVRSTENVDTTESQIFDFSTNVPNEMFKLNNVGSSDDWRKQDFEEVSKETFKDTVEIHAEVQEMFNRMLLLVPMRFWNGNTEDGLDKIQTAFCQHSLELDATAGVAEAANEAISKEKFVPRGTARSMVKEESRK